MAVAPVFVVTGGAAGIGAAVAEEAVRRGYRVAIADHDGAALERKAAELKSISNEAKVLAYVMDVTSVEQNFAFRDEVLKTYGRADVVHLNAGIFTKDARMLGSWTKEGMSDADRKAGLQKNHAAWKKVYDVNFFGVVHGTQVWISTLLAQRQREPDGIAPTLVCTASTMGLVIAGPLSGSNAGYQSGKAGLIACYEALQVELLKRGEVPGESVNVACLCPGGVATAITAAMPATDPTLVSAADAAASLHSWLLLPPANRPFLIDTHNDFVRSAFGVRAAYIEG